MTRQYFLKVVSPHSFPEDAIYLLTNTLDQYQDWPTKFEDVGVALRATAHAKDTSVCPIPLGRLVTDPTLIDPTGGAISVFIGPSSYF